MNRRSFLSSVTAACAAVVVAPAVFVRALAKKDAPVDAPDPYAIQFAYKYELRDTTIENQTLYFDGPVAFGPNAHLRNCVVWFSGEGRFELVGNECSLTDCLVEAF